MFELVRFGLSDGHEKLLQAASNFATEIFSAQLDPERREDRFVILSLRNRSTPVERLRSTSKQSRKWWRESGKFPCFTRLFQSHIGWNDLGFSQYSIAHFLRKVYIFLKEEKNGGKLQQVLV